MEYSHSQYYGYTLGHRNFNYLGRGTYVGFIRQHQDSTDSANERATEQEFRQQCLQAFTKHQALDFMFEQVKDIALKGEQL